MNLTKNLVIFHFGEFSLRHLNRHISMVTGYNMLILACQVSGSDFGTISLLQPDNQDLYLHWKSCFSPERQFSAVCQTSKKSRTGIDPEDPTCLGTLGTKVFEYRYHLEKNLNSRDIKCPMKVAYRRGKTLYNSLSFMVMNYP